MRHFTSDSHVPACCDLAYMRCWRRQGFGRETLKGRRDPRVAAPLIVDNLVTATHIPAGKSLNQSLLWLESSSGMFELSFMIVGRTRP